ncbi:MAG TPA: hypothetical protein PLX50_03395 [Candidatus Aminicenantes bacterium]|nr:hypothetical protein [Candidatus Aminicenantes bacterium]
MLASSAGVAGKHDPNFRRGFFSAKNLAILIFVLFAVILVRTAWICDDAYITFRTVDNFVHGRGLTWNIDERVQVYTHPLWLFLVSSVYFLTREIYFSVTALSFFITLAAAGIMAWRASSGPRSAAMALLLGSSSKAFVDYSTSGLENPLTHLLLVSFVLVFLRGEFSSRRLFHLSFLAGLAACCRPDTILMYLPALVFAVIKSRDRKRARSVLLGFLPFILWETFSMIYYGFPFPNTAYAKLGTGISTPELVRQGGFYLLNSLRTDPLTLAALAAGTAWACFRRNRRLLPIAFGAWVYLAYVVRIGGDFMSGRFLTGPFFLAVLLLSQVGWRRAAVFGSSFLIVAVAASLLPLAPIRSGPGYNRELLDRHGIADERGFYFPYSGLLASGRMGRAPVIEKEAGLKARAAGGVEVKYAIGFFGFFAGPGVHIIDPYGISDPLIARLPAVHNPRWRIGHFVRFIPRGYVRTLRHKEILLDDRNLGEYYRRLNLIVRGKLFSLPRLREIYYLNTGRCNGLIDRSFYRFPSKRAAAGR